MNNRPVETKTTSSVQVLLFVLILTATYLVVYNLSRWQDTDILIKFSLLCIDQIHNTQITYKMHFSGYDVFYSQCSHQIVSAATAAIFRVMLLLQQYKGTNVVSCVDVTPQQLKICIVSLKIV
jgi:hypothetical protein